LERLLTTNTNIELARAQLKLLQRARCEYEHVLNATGLVQLKDLGANSVDRVEIVTLCLDALAINLPLLELAGVSDIGGLIDALHARCSARDA
jgi:acyl carrier protein